MKHCNNLAKYFLLDSCTRQIAKQAENTTCERVESTNKRKMLQIKRPNHFVLLHRKQNISWTGRVFPQMPLPPLSLTHSLGASRFVERLFAKANKKSKNSCSSRRNSARCGVDSKAPPRPIPTRIDNHHNHIRTYTPLSTTLPPRNIYLLQRYCTESSHDSIMKRWGRAGDLLPTPPPLPCWWKSEWEGGGRRWLSL